jgi:hypothetical protein
MCVYSTVQYTHTSYAYGSTIQYETGTVFNVLESPVFWGAAAGL